MGSARAFVFAGAATLLSLPAANAADLPAYPPQAPVVQEFSGWYLRGDIGFSNQSLGSLFNQQMVTGSTITTDRGESFDAAPFFGLGLGYQVNNWLRFDVTGEYRAKANFNGADTATWNGGGMGADSYTANKSEWTGLVNAYVDLGTWWSITPFVGAGVGASYNIISNFTDIGSSPGAIWYAPNRGTWNLAWAAYAGLAYKVTPGFTVELAYRYLDLGNAQTGNAYTYDPAYNNNTQPFYFNHITSQDVKLGVRWMFAPEPVYAPPLITKG